MAKLEKTPGIGCTPYNLGTGTGTTVLEMVHAFEAASGLKVRSMAGAGGGAGLHSK